MPISEGLEFLLELSSSPMGEIRCSWPQYDFPLVSRIPNRMGRLRKAPGIKHWFPVKGVLPSLKSSILVLPLPSFILTPNLLIFNFPLAYDPQPRHFYFHYIYKSHVFPALNLDVESGSPHPYGGWKAEPKGIQSNILASRGQCPEKPWDFPETLLLTWQSLAIKIS